jgi:peptide/nickel transport system permease protein
MFRLMFRGLLVSLPVLVVMTALVFVLIALLPGNPAVVILGMDATPDQIASLDAKLGLDQPLIVQYFTWLGHVITGNFGQSLYNNQPVSDLINQHLTVTIVLMTGTVLVSAIIGTTLGAVSAVRGGRLGQAVDVLGMLGFSVPNFWLAYLLVALVAVQLGLLPATGYVDFTAGPTEWFQSLILPVLALSAAPIAAIAKQTRDSVKSVLNSPFVVSLRGYGMSEREIFFHHIARNAAIPVVTSLGLVTAGLLGGTVLIEKVFVMPGLGSLAVQSAGERDIPVILSVVLFFGIGTVLINLLTDLSVGILDPRTKRSH